MRYLLILFLFAACSPSIDPQSVQAKLDATPSTRVEELRIERNVNSPISYLIVEPVRVSDKGNQKETDIKLQGELKTNKVTSLSGQADINVMQTEIQNYLLPRQRQISIQFVSALSGVGDFNLIDYDAYLRTPEKYKALTDGNGPFMVRAVITESADAVLSEERKRNLPLIYKSEEFLSESIVGLDVSIVNIKSGQILTSFPVRGTHIYKSAKSKSGLITNITKDEVAMRSTIDQALRVALNNAALKLHQRLYENTN